MNDYGVSRGMKYIMKTSLLPWLLLCALCEMGCLPPSTQCQTALPGTVGVGPVGEGCTGTPRITNAQASDEFTHLPAGKVQIEVSGNGFTPNTTARLAVGSIRIPVVVGSSGQFSSATIGSLPCGEETTASARDVNGSQSNSFPFQVYCVR